MHQVGPPPLGGPVQIVWFLPNVRVLRACEFGACKFGGFLGFGSDTVLLQLDEVEIMRNDSGTVALRTALTPEALEGRPAHEGW